MARGDIIYTQAGATLIIKWTKTIQDKTTHTIAIPDFGHSEFCPIAALKDMLAFYPGRDNDTFFKYITGDFLAVLTDSMSRKYLKKSCKYNLLCLQEIHFGPSIPTWHYAQTHPGPWDMQIGCSLALHSGPSLYLLSCR